MSQYPKHYSNSKTPKREWRGSTIKCLPYVEREVYDRNGRKKRERNVEEMIRLFKKRVQKSGIMEKVQEKRHYTKPSTKRRQEREEIEYELDKMAKREKEAKRIRGDRR